MLLLAVRGSLFLGEKHLSEMTQGFPRNTGKCSHERKEQAQRPMVLEGSSAGEHCGFNCVRFFVRLIFIFNAILKNYLFVYFALTVNKRMLLP